MAPDEEARRRLAIAMDERRVELRLKWNQVAQRADMSIGHLSRIRNNETPLSDLAKASLEAAMEWPRGRIDAILAAPDTDAGTPESVTSPDEADDIGVTRILAILEVQRRELAELRRRDAEREAELKRLSDELRSRDADNGHRRGA